MNRLQHGVWFSDVGDEQPSRSRSAQAKASKTISVSELAALDLCMVLCRHAAGLSSAGTEH